MKIELLKHNDGFTLVEVLIAIALLATALLALGSLATSNMKTVELAKRQTQAINLATEKIEQLNVIAYNLLGRDPEGATELNGNNLLRTCAAPILNSDGQPYMLCDPDKSPVTYSTPQSSIDFYWEFSVTYINFDLDSKIDGDGDDAVVSTLIDPGDIKMVTVRVWWTDIYGPHEIELSSLRGKTT